VHAAIRNSVQPSALQFWPFSTAISFQVTLKLESTWESGGEGPMAHVCVKLSGSAATTKADLQNRVEDFEKLSLQKGPGINSPRSVG
jgi:hypothetical protein